MSYTSYMAKFSRVTKYFQEIIRKEGLVPTKVGDHFTFKFKQSGLGPVATKMIAGIYGNSPNTIEIFIFGKMLSDGPKLFKPRQVDLEMLEQMNLNIEFTDYVQPFHTVVVELPENYLKSKQVHSPQGGEWYYGNRLPTTHEPVFVVLHHGPELNCILSAVCFNDDLSIKTAMCPKTGDIIDDYLEGFTVRETFKDSLETSEAEWQVVKDCLRASMNYCLLLDEFGTRKIGPGNPSYHSRLQRYVRVAERSGNQERLSRSSDELIAHPIVYEINQQVKLVKSVKSHEELAPGPVGKSMPPHHRRGYYRMQPCGEGSKLRKRIRIQPVFVNKHLFFGNMEDAKATYE